MDAESVFPTGSRQISIRCPRSSDRCIDDKRSDDKRNFVF